MPIFLLLGLPLLMGTLALFLRNDMLRKLLLFSTSLVHLGTTFFFLQKSHSFQLNSFLGFDAIGLLVLAIISILFFIVSLYLFGYLKKENSRSNRIFIGCLLYLLSAMTLVTMSQHMGLLWIALEATTLLSAAQINYDRTSKSIEATWKYLLISSVGIALGLLATFFLAVSARNIETLFLEDILSHATTLTPSWLKLSILFFLVGYGTKMGLAPMHTWKPDAYGEAPAPTGALMSGALTACAFLAIFRIAQICFHAHLQEFVSPIFILLGILSLGIAAIFILDQKDFQRMLGYSSVEHMGILVLGLGLGGQAIWASLFHLINNAFAKGFIFLIAGNIQRTFQTKKIKDLQGIIHQLPATGTFLILGFMIITGFPPFGIFYSELLIAREALSTQHYKTIFFYLLFLSIIFFGFSKIILGISLGKPIFLEQNTPPKETFFMIFPPILLLIVLCFSGVFVPDFLYHLLDESSKLLNGN